MIYKPKHFALYEVFPQAFYEENKHLGDRLWVMFDYYLLITLDRLRERYGRATINNWYWGGEVHFRGWRPFESKIGSFFSQHKFGRAFDIIFKDASAEEVREDARKLYQIRGNTFEYIMRIEEGVRWLHVDRGHQNRASDGIRFFQP